MKKFIVLIIISFFTLCGVTQKARANSDVLLFEIAEPTPGFHRTTTVALNYVSLDGQFMLLQVWDPVWRIFSSTWNPVLGKWDPPHDLGFPNWTGSSCLSPDGLTMYYGYGDGIPGVSRSRKTTDGWTLPPEKIPGSDSNPTSTYFNGTNLYSTHFYADIWVAEYNPDNDTFFPSVPVDSVNTSEWKEYQPWVSLDGTLLLFASDRSGGYGGHDLWCATWDPQLQIWTNIMNLGPNVNSELNESNPFLTELADRKILYFERGYSGAERQIMQALVLEPVTFVAIDIKPGSYPNAINLGSQGLTPVAILSEIGFDARTVNPATVNLAGALVAMRGKDKYMAHAEDVNKDGLVDLVVQVVTCDIDPSKLRLDGDKVYAVLTGQTIDGKDIEGEDEVTIVPGEK